MPIARQLKSLAAGGNGSGRGGGVGGGSSGGDGGGGVGEVNAGDGFGWL